MIIPDPCNARKCCGRYKKAIKECTTCITLREDIQDLLKHNVGITGYLIVSSERLDSLRNFVNPYYPKEDYE